MSVASYSTHSSLSSNGSATWFTGNNNTIIGRLITQLHAFFFVIVTKTTSYPKLTFAILLLEYFQWYTFNQINHLHAIGDVDTKGLRFLEFFRTFGSGYLPEEGQILVLFVILFYISILTALFLWLYWKLRSGLFEHAISLKKEGGMFLEVSQVLVDFVHFLYLPLIGYLWDIVFCSYGHSIKTEIERDRNPQVAWDGAYAIFSVLALLGFTLLFVITAICSLFAVEWMPSKKSYSSTVSNRVRAIMFVGKTILFFLDLGLDYSSDFSATSIIMGVIFLIFNLLILSWVAYRQPYHRWQINLAIIVFMAWTTMEGFIRMVLLLSNAVPLAAGLCILFFSIAAAVPAYFIGRRRVVRLHRLGMNPQQGQEVIDSPFAKEFEVEVAARQGYYSSADQVIEHSVGCFLQGADQFPQSSDVRVWHAVLLLVHSDDIHLLSIAILRAQKLVLHFDTAFVLACLERHRKNILFDKDGGVQEISESLKKASHYQDDCMQYIRLFWAHLMKEQELGSLTDLVASIESSEKQAEAIYKNLLVRFPKSSRVLRSYGEFLEQIKNDLELSQTAYRTADDLEEEANHKKRHTKKNALIHSKKNFGVEEPTPIYDNFVETTSDEEVIPENRSFESPPLELTKPRENIEIARAKRRNTVTQKRYRNNIEKTRSKALTLLRIAVILTILVILVDVACIFGALEIISGQYKNVFHVLTSTAVAAFYIQDMPWHCREIQFGLAQNNSQQVINVQEQLQLASDTFIEHTHIEEMAFTNHRMYNLWTAPTYARIDFQPVTGIRSFSNDTFYNIINRLVSQGRSLASADLQPTDNLTERVDFRFILDNAPRSINYGLYNMQQEALKVTMRNSHTAKNAFIIVFAVSAAILILSLLSFWFATTRIRKERLGVLKLFLAIPKGTIQSIFEQITKKDDDLLKDFEDTDETQETAATLDADTVSQGMPVLKKLTYRYIIVVILLFGLVCCLFSFGIVLITSTTQSAPEIRAIDVERTLVSRILLFSQEVYLMDFETWEGGIPQIFYYLIESSTLLKILHKGVIFGDKNFDMDGLRDDYTDWLVEQAPCTLPSGAECHGLNSVFNEYLKYQEQITSLPPEAFGVIAEWMPDIAAIEKEYLRLLTMLSDHHQGIINNQIDLSRTLGITFLVISMPCFVIGFIVLLPLQRKMHQENERTIKMLLMIPIDVIENVKVIKEYLTSGERASSESKIKDALEESFGRMKSIVEGSIDAIIVVDANGIIEIWNPAAEKLFGYKSEEVIGKNVKIIIPENQQKAHEAGMRRYLATRQSTILGKTIEVQGKKRDGNLVPLHLEINEGKVGQRQIFCAFLKDITDINKWKKDLQKEKDKSEKLLYSFLPKQIANQLIREGEEEERSLIAESYKEVTIIFADIVGFTKMSSSIGASELIHLLNTLFSQWDRLCERHKVEKIKTIGDCYMAASGVPERCLDHATRMMEFAIDLLESLNKFNIATSNNLKLRIGINSGSVVAGVIGAKKYAFDLWGDAVNVASRMESTGVPNRIQVSQSTFEILKQDYLFEERGRVEVKGKGTMLTYLFKERMLQRTDSGKLKRRAAITPPPALKGLTVTASFYKGQFDDLITSHNPSMVMDSTIVSPQEEEKEVEMETFDTEHLTDDVIDSMLQEDSKEEIEPSHPNQVQEQVSTQDPTEVETASKKIKKTPIRRNSVVSVRHSTPTKSAKKNSSKSSVKFDN